MEKTNKDGMVVMEWCIIALALALSLAMFLSLWI
jgi:hypothetical protein